jgi:hypothetical protein
MDELVSKVGRTLGFTELADLNIKQDKVKNCFDRFDYWASNHTDSKRTYSNSDPSIFKGLLQEFHELSERSDAKRLFDSIAKDFGIQGAINSTYEAEKGIYFPNIDGLALPNFGYGYTQLLSLFFKIFNNWLRHREYWNGEISPDKPSLLMLEEPEVNLHPNLQSKLADLFVKTGRASSTQFLIETHSEYMIRKFQYLVMKGELKPEDIVIYYFKDPNDTSKEPLVKKITIQNDGRLSEPFGKGFLDETGRLMASLLTGEYLN